MHGIGAPLRQFIVTAKPWQRMAAGVVVIAVGVLLSNYVLTAFGVVFVVLPVAAWLKRWRGGGGGGGPEGPDAGDGGVGAAASDVPLDARDD
jgi:hypothetical protein